MIDFEITFQADELSYEDYEKISLISEICSENFYDNLNQDGITSLTKFKYLVLQQTVSAIMDLAF